jgi:predicted TIM-barrel fold metal-dependent hydrolase
MRLRPPAKGFESLALFWDKERIFKMTKAMGFQPPQSYIKDSFNELLEEMKEANIEIGVITGRHGGKHMGFVPNDVVAALVQNYPGKFWGLGSVDISNISNARKQIEDIMANRILCGVVIESGLAEHPKYVDDNTLDQLFGDCEDANIPVLLMAGGNAGPDLSYSCPIHLDKVAARHSKLQIRAAHGSWPWVNEILGVAYRRANVWLSPDMYLFLPGWQLYVDAANGYLQDRFLFGSAYPALPLKPAVERFLELPFLKEVQQKVLFENALHLFKKELTF